MATSQQSEQILIALRRVNRAIDLHSRKLAQTHGLTSPQAVVLKAAATQHPLTTGELADRVSLSQATVTDILKRLEQRGLIERRRDTRDRRRVLVSVTQDGQQLVATAPPLLQERFLRRFEQLKDWERNLLIASIQRTAELMDAEELDVAPMLSNGPICPPSPCDEEESATTV